ICPPVSGAGAGSEFAIAAARRSAFASLRSAIASRRLALRSDNAGAVSVGSLTLGSAFFTIGFASGVSAARGALAGVSARVGFVVVKFELAEDRCQKTKAPLAINIATIPA